MKPLKPIKPDSTVDTSKISRRHRREPAKPRIGLALAGGGPLGAVYEIGALAAINESIEGIDVNDAVVYVGISAGGIIAAGLANGITPYEMCRLFVENDTDNLAEAAFRPELLLKPAWSELCKRVESTPGLIYDSMLHYVTGLGNSSLASSFERMKQIFPAGILSSEGIQEFMQRTLSAPGRTDDFRQLQRHLVLVATDLDSGESVRYGEPGFDDVPISKAAQASAAVPGLFPPVEIKGRQMVDGVLRKTLHASIALDYGVDILICLNPIVSFNATTMYEPGKLAAGGLFTVLSQTLRSIIHSRVERGISKYDVLYPTSDIFLFEPDPEDAEMFFTNLFSSTTHRRMCENAYQHTRAMLWKRRVEIDKKLSRHGMHLKHSVLLDTGLILVKKAPLGKRDYFGINKLSHTLDELEHKLRLADD